MTCRLFLIAAIILAGLLASQTPTFAATNFSTQLQTTYSVTTTGSTLVTQVLTLTNKTPTEYITRYGLKITSPDITQITVKSNGQAVVPEIVNTETQTSIGITFPDVIAGEGKQRIIEISYRDPDAAIISGKVLEVLVPKLATVNEYDAYSLSLITPAQFGAPTRVTPNSYSVTQQDNAYITSLVLNQGESVTALYGTQQIFDFDLKYHLTNSSPNTGLAQIALPPDTSFQKVNYDRIEPQPQKIELDADGNWIATYQVPSEATVVVQAQGQAYLSLSQLNSFVQPADLDTWLTGQEFWEIHDLSIQELAEQYHSPKQIYDYVVENLDYNYASLDNNNPRLGAVNALKAPDQAACQEFTDLFIAMARATGIPARRVTGYAYTQNNLLRPLDLNRNVLHAWPEYYDRARRQWIPVDPTWGNTTGGVNYFDQFDLNHLVFAVNGQSSTLPYPVGSYAPDQKTADQTIKVTFGTDFLEIPPQLDIAATLGDLGGIPMAGKNKLAITNRTGQAWYNIILKPTSAATEYSLPTSLAVPELLPFQTAIIAVPVYYDGWLTTGQIPLQLTADYEDISKERHTISLNSVELSVGGRAFYYLGQPIFAVALGTSCVLGFILAGSVLVRGTKRSRPVRRKS